MIVVELTHTSISNWRLTASAAIVDCALTVILAKPSPDGIIGKNTDLASPDLI